MLHLPKSRIGTFFVVTGPSYTELPQDIQILLRSEIWNVSAAYARVDVLHQDKRERKMLLENYVHKAL